MSPATLRRPIRGEAHANPNDFSLAVLRALIDLGVAPGESFTVDVAPAPGVYAVGAVDAPSLGPFRSETSRKAALANFPRSGTQRFRLLSALAGSPAGLTREELALVTRVRPDAVRPRVLELIEGDWAFETEQTRRTVCGQEAAVLSITPRGLEEHKRREVRDA